MSFYRLAYQTSGGQSLPLPDEVNKNASVEVLQAFAEKCGHESFDWDRVELSPADDITDPLNQLNWSSFQQALEQEPALFAYPWDVFERRIEGGYLNAIVDSDNNVIGTVNIIPKLNDALRAFLGIQFLNVTPQVYETGAGWVAEPYRGVGLYTPLRAALVAESEASNRLIFSQARGKGASNVNIRNGWTLVNWNEFPFSSALMGWVERSKNSEEHFRLAPGITFDLPEDGVFNQRTVETLSGLGAEFVRAYDFSKTHNLWVNNLEMLKKLEEAIRFQLGLDVIPSMETARHARDLWRRRIADSMHYDRDLVALHPETRGAWDALVQDKPNPDGKMG